MTDTHVIIAGDSNALGYLNTGAAPYVATAPVQIWTGGAWNYLNPGVNTGTPNNPTAWGPEVQFAKDWLAVHADDGSHLWIVKDAATVKGSTSLAVDWAPASGHMFASTSADVSAAMHNLDGTAYAFDHYDGALIVLGENDAVNPAFAAAYHDNLIAFNSAARAAWHVTTLLESRIEDTMGAPADNLAVRDAQWQVDQADAAMVSFRTIGFEQQPDHVHYDAVGQLALGHAFFDAAPFL